MFLELGIDLVSIDELFEVANGFKLYQITPEEDLISKFLSYQGFSENRYYWIVREEYIPDIENDIFFQDYHLFFSTSFGKGKKIRNLIETQFEFEIFEEYEKRKDLILLTNVNEKNHLSKKGKASFILLHRKKDKEDYIIPIVGYEIYRLNKVPTSLKALKEKTRELFFEQKGLPFFEEMTEIYELRFFTENQKINHRKLILGFAPKGQYFLRKFYTQEEFEEEVLKDMKEYDIYTCKNEDSNSLLAIHYNSFSGVARWFLKIKED